MCANSPASRAGPLGNTSSNVQKVLWALGELRLPFERIDAGDYPMPDLQPEGGYTIPPYYDSLIGKLIVYGRTREECLQRLRRAVDEFVVDGVKTTLPLFQRLIKEPDVLAGNYDIHWLEKFLSASKG